MTIAMPTSMLTHALEYARRGWPVFPCDPKTKRPLIPRDKGPDGKPLANTGGLRKATTDPETISAWWRKWPDALIGVRLGRETGLWVVDFDPRGESVEAVKARFLAEVGPLPRGPVSRTQSGGEHVWLLMPDGEVPKNSAKRIQNVDWRAEGGYVIVPPSQMANGNKYEWLAEGEFPAAPAHVLDLVFRRGKFAPPVTKMAGTGIRPSDEKIRRYCLAALDKSAGRVALLPDGQKNQGLNDEALAIGHLVGAGGLTEQEAFDSLRLAALSWGITDADRALTAGGTLERAIRDGAREPADLSHVGTRTRPRPEREPEPEYEREELPPHDPDTGELIEDDEPDIGQYDEPETSPERQRAATEFKCLGYNKGTYYYLPRGTGQVVSLKASEHTKLRMFELADINHWLRLAGTKFTKETWDEFANSLMRQSEQTGIFDEARIRGRGAWVDGKRIVVHTGGEAHIGGDVLPLHEVKSRYIYEAGPPWEFGFGDPATSQEAHRLVNVFERLTWSDKLSGALAAGWCVIAPVSGALTWRSHIWITGPSGAGKTTAVDAVKRVVGPSAFKADGKTSEAAIRQRMGYDARPVILDEVESEDQAAVARVQGVLDLARVSSSGGEISKGGANHKAVNFVIRSCFCFSSINTAVRHKADESRVSKLVLVPNKSADSENHYQGLVRDIDAWFDENYASRMFTRTIQNLPVLLKNCATFTTAAAIVFKSRRAADQLGPMLAGYYLCHRTDAITLDAATAFIRKHDWDDFVGMNGDADEMRLFQYIISRPLRVNLPFGTTEVTIGTAIEESRGEMGRGPYTMALGARGIKVDDEMIGISDNAENTRAMFKDKPEWSADWKGPLRNIPGAMKSRDSERFAGGIKSRLTWIPYAHLTGSFVPREPGEGDE